MAREFNRVFVAVLTPIFRALGFVVSNIYSLLFGWYDKRLARTEQARLEQEIREHLAFLFSRENAQMSASRDIKHLRDIDWPSVTITVDGLLLHFRRWRGELQVYVAPEQAPDTWEELSLLFSLIETHERIERQSSYRLSDVAGWLKANLDVLKNAFSQSGYPMLKERLAEAYKYDRAVVRQWETEINRRLYG